MSAERATQSRFTIQRWKLGVRRFAFTSPPLAPLATENAIAVRPADKSRRDAARIVGTAPRQSNGRWWHALPSPLTQNPPPPAPAPVAHLPRRCVSAA